MQSHILGRSAETQPEESLLIPPAVCPRLCIVAGHFPICAETTECVTTLKWIKGLTQFKIIKQKNPLTCISPAVSVPYTGVLAAAEAHCSSEGQRREHLTLVLLLGSFSCENSLSYCFSLNFTLSFDVLE